MLYGLAAVSSGRLRDPQSTISLVNGEIYVTAGGEISQQRIYRWNGSELKPLTDVRSGLTGSNPREPQRVGEQFVVAADDGVHGRELWTISETASGAHRVRLDEPQFRDNLDFGVYNFVNAEAPFVA